MREDWREDVAARGNDTRRGLTTSAASHTTLFVCQVKPALQRTGDLSSCMAHAYKGTVLFSSMSRFFFFGILVAHQITSRGTQVETCPRRRRRGDGGGPHQLHGRTPTSTARESAGGVFFHVLFHSTHQPTQPRRSGYTYTRQWRPRAPR